MSPGLRINKVQLFIGTVKPVLSGHSKTISKLAFKADYRLMQVKRIERCYITFGLRPVVVETFVLSILVAV